MIDRSQAVSIYTEFLKETLTYEQWYADISKSLQATLLYGSVAKGTNTKDSDIDILLILPLSVEEAFTKGEYVYDHHGTEINIVLRSIEKLRHIAKQHNDRFQKEVFRDSVIISSDDEVRELLRSISMIPTHASVD